MAGGGTLLTFPALLAVLPSVQANATSTLALVPGALASAWGYRREVAAMRSWLKLLLLPSLAGGVIGALLLTQLPASVFDAAIPWLILTATLLLALQPAVARMIRGAGAKPLQKETASTSVPSPTPVLAGLILLQLVISIYGGYFGAGMGIMMLAALGLMHLTDIHQMNGLKSIIGAVTNGVSVVVFAWQAVIDWPVALAMAGAAIAGGYLGARVARRIDQAWVRGGIIVIGLTLSAYYAFHRA